jgi:hypothetical protein
MPPIGGLTAILDSQPSDLLTCASHPFIFFTASYKKTPHGETLDASPHSPNPSRHSPFSPPIPRSSLSIEQSPSRELEPAPCPHRAAAHTPAPRRLLTARSRVPSPCSPRAVQPEKRPGLCLRRAGCRRRRVLRCEAARRAPQCHQSRGGRPC